jgi:hypothetical protein
MVDVDIAGYLSPEYATSLAEWGEPVKLPLSGGWVLRREIPQSRYRDAMGVYPLLCCTDWEKLEQDVGALHDLVSLVFVSDPFASIENSLWLDLYAPYETHLLVDYGQPVKPSKHHRYYAKQYESRIEVVIEPDMSEWTMLYDTLIDRHEITGIQAFSRRSFAEQFNTPGLVAFRAYRRNVPLGIHLWYMQGDVAYSHLAACSYYGYEEYAAYGLMQAALEFFDGGVRYLDLGATGSTGLDFFENGWSNDSKIAYLCGKILDLDAYKELVGIDEKRYFPAYRG